MTHVPPVEVARLSRYDAAVVTGRKARTGAAADRTARQAAAPAGAALTCAFDRDIVFAKPIQVSVALRTPYAAELLRGLRSAKKPRRGARYQISVDCPVEIVVDGATLEALIDKLEAEVGGAGGRTTH